MFNLFPQHPAPYLGPADWKQGASMTLRDHFAGLAMQALISCTWKERGDTDYVVGNDDDVVNLHRRAYEHADAMMKARSNT